MSDNFVVTSGRVEGPIAWPPRVARHRSRRARGASVEPEARVLIRAIAIGLAVFLLLELRIHTIEAPASVPHETMRALRTLGSRSLGQ
jgi:hypothetical protein